MNGSNPWSLVATAVALVLVTSLLIAAVAWTTTDAELRGGSPAIAPAKSASERMGAVASQATAMSPPPPYAVAACRRQASQLQPPDGWSAAPRAEASADGPAQPDERYLAAYARCMRSRGYAN